MGIIAAYAVPHPPLIVPSVGRGEERAIQPTIDAYREIARRIADHAPDTIVVTSPHAPFYRDCFYLSAAESERGSMARFGVPGERIEYVCDTEFASAIARTAGSWGVPVAFGSRADGELGQDHATFVPLYFIRDLLPHVRIVRAGLSLLPYADHRTFGEAIAHASEKLGRRVVFVASGDLSHKLKEDGPYGFAPEGPRFDREIARIFSTGALDDLFALDEDMCEAAAECGLRSFQIMTGVLGGLPHTSELLSCEGPFGVGYAVAAFEVKDRGAEQHESVDGASCGLEDADEDGFTSAVSAAVDPYVALARASVEGYVRTGRTIAVPPDTPRELLGKRAGVFVSLHIGEALRGCIGTIAPCYGSVADEIVANGVSACSCDSRFAPVRPDELDRLSYSVDVLYPPEPIDSTDKLDPSRYGVIVTKGHRRGLLLPNLDGVDTVADQVAIAKRKAGLSPYDDDVELERFEVVRHTRGGEARIG